MTLIDSARGRSVGVATQRKTKVLVIGGGQSVEHDASLASARAVSAALARGGYEVCMVTISREGIWQIPDAISGDTAAESLALAMMLMARTDVVFPVAKGGRGEDGALAGLCALAGVRVVGSGLRAGAIGLDKWATKQVARAVGIRTARGLLVDAADIGDLEFQGAAVVKPVVAGSSLGVSLVREESRLGPALEEAARYSDRVLVEEVIVGREIAVAVIREAGGVRWVAPPLERHAAGVLHAGAGRADGRVRASVPARLEPEEDTALMHAALKMYDALGCAGVARMDFSLTPDGPVLNEVDTMPGLSETSRVPRMFAAAGVGFDELVARLVRAA